MESEIIEILDDESDVIEILSNDPVTSTQIVQSGDKSIDVLEILSSPVEARPPIARPPIAKSTKPDVYKSSDVLNNLLLISDSDDSDIEIQLREKRPIPRGTVRSEHNGSLKQSKSTLRKRSPSSKVDSKAHSIPINGDTPRKIKKPKLFVDSSFDSSTDAMTPLKNPAVKISTPHKSPYTATSSADINKANGSFSEMIDDSSSFADAHLLKTTNELTPSSKPQTSSKLSKFDASFRSNEDLIISTDSDSDSEFEFELPTKNTQIASTLNVDKGISDFATTNKTTAISESSISTSKVAGSIPRSTSISSVSCSSAILPKALSAPNFDKVPTNSDSLLFELDEFIPAIRSKSLATPSSTSLTSVPTVRSKTYPSTTTSSINNPKTKLSKGEKELEKQKQRDFKLANKTNRTKDELLSEMIIRIPNKITQLFSSSSLTLQTELNPVTIALLDKNGIFADSCIEWQRTCHSRYDAELNIFQPCEKHLIDEDILCLVFKSEEFVEMIETEGNLLEKLNRFKQNSSDKYKSFIILIINLDLTISKIKNYENREFTEKVRQNLTSTIPTTSSSSTLSNPKKAKKSKSTQINIKIEEIENFISKLQINGFKVLPTKNIHETCQWLLSFTYTISSKRYDINERYKDLANIGNIKSGLNIKDTYCKILQHFKRVTTLKAERILDYYPTLNSLYQAFLQNNDSMIGQDGKHVIGVANAKVMRKVFTSIDEDEIFNQDV